MCGCTLIILLMIGGGHLSIETYFTQPRECRVFSMPPNVQEHRFVFGRETMGHRQTVEIPVPPKELQGRWHVRYCWGEEKASLGYMMVPVFLSPVEHEAFG